MADLLGDRLYVKACRRTQAVFGGETVLNTGASEAASERGNFLGRINAGWRNESLTVVAKRSGRVLSNAEVTRTTQMVATARMDRTERILVVEDEDSIRDLVTTALRFVGFPVATAASGREAIAEARNEQFDLVVLDVNLPDVDGYEICRKLRADGNQAAVIFLTARDDPSDLKTGFTAGGDDYLTKPFSLEELMLRIDAVLRRTRGNQVENAKLTAGDVVLDQDAYQVWRGGDEISLSPTEFRLLRYLMQNQDRVVSKNQILDHVWDYEYVGELNAVETYVSYLRKKLNDKDAHLIRTVRGFGYSIRSA